MSSTKNPEWIKALLKKLNSLQKDQSDNIAPKDLETLIKEFSSTVGAYASVEKREKIYSEVDTILKQVPDLKHETFTTEEEILKGSLVPNISIELRSVIEQTEQSAGGILDVADSIRNISQQDISKPLSDELTKNSTKLLELCNFQDLTGQIIRKIIKNLTDIESTISNIFNILSQDQRVILKKKITPAPAKDELLNGPQQDKDRPSQTAVDDLFDKLG